MGWAHAPHPRDRARARRLQPSYLIRAQVPPRSARQRAEPERAVTRAMEPRDAQSHRLAHSAHLPVASLVQDDLDLGPLGSRVPDPDLAGRADGARLELNALAQATDLRPVGRPVEPHAVELPHPVARMHEVVGELAIVGGDDQAAGLGIEPADREQARPGRQQRAHGRSSLGIVERRDDPDRLVDHHVAERGAPGDRASVHLDAVAVGYHVGAGLLDHGAVDPHRAGLDQRIALASRSDAATGEQLVETYSAGDVRGVCRRSSARHRGPGVRARSRGPGFSRRCAALRGRPAPRATPCTRCLARAFEGWRRARDRTRTPCPRCLARTFAG